VEEQAALKRVRVQREGVNVYVGRARRQRAARGGLRGRRRHRRGRAV